MALNSSASASWVASGPSSAPPPARLSPPSTRVASGSFAGAGAGAALGAGAAGAGAGAGAGALPGRASDRPPRSNSIMPLLLGAGVGAGAALGAGAGDGDTSKLMLLESSVMSGA